MIAAVDHLEGEVDRGRSTGTANPKAAGAAVAAEAAMAVGAAGAVASGSGSELPWLLEPISLSLSLPHLERTKRFPGWGHDEPTHPPSPRTNEMISRLGSRCVSLSESPWESPFGSPFESPFERNTLASRRPLEPQAVEAQVAVGVASRETTGPQEAAGDHRTTGSHRRQPQEVTGHMQGSSSQDAT